MTLTLPQIPESATDEIGAFLAQQVAAALAERRRLQAALTEAEAGIARCDAYAAAAYAAAGKMGVVLPSMEELAAAPRPLPAAGLAEQVLWVLETCGPQTTGAEVARIIARERGEALTANQAHGLDTTLHLLVKRGKVSKTPREGKRKYVYALA